MFSFLCALSVEETPKIKYLTIAQITNVYSETHLSTQTESTGNAFEIPGIYASRQGFEDGWLWSIETPQENITEGQNDIQCGSRISVINQFSQNYISVKNSKVVVPTVGSMGNSSTWKVICEKEGNWHQNDEFFLFNELQQCYLSGSFEYMYDGDTSKYKVICSPSINKLSIWSVKEGVFFKETPVPEPEEQDQEL